MTKTARAGAGHLRQALIETTGNVYLRRLAAQALVESAPEDCCEVFRYVAENEADIAFLSTLGNMLDQYCP